jgi:hypothetical protein
MTAVKARNYELDCTGNADLRQPVRPLRNSCVLYHHSYFDQPRRETVPYKTTLPFHGLKRR